MHRLLLFFILLIPCAQANQDLYDLDRVRSFHVTFKQANWWSLLVANYSSRTELEADLVVDSRLYQKIGIRFRGSSSYIATGSSQKKSFNISMDKFVPGQDLLGYDSLNLSNSFNDPTFMREVTSYGILRKYMPAPKANFIKLYINNEYWGIYVNVQQMEKSFLKEWFADAAGNRYRCDPPQSSGRGKSAMQWLGTSPSSYQAAYELKTTSNPTPWTDLIQACNVLNNTPLAQLPADLPKVFDVDRAMWYLALNIVMVNLDSYVGRGNDYYLYNDGHSGTLTMLPWDMNESFGGYSASMSITSRINLTPFWQESNYSSRPLIYKTYRVPEWRERYIDHIRTIVKYDFNWSSLGAFVNKYQTMIDADVKADTKKLYSYQAFRDNVTMDVKLGSGFWTTTVPGLKKLVEGRHTYLGNHADIKNPAPQLQELAHSPVEPKSTDTIAITVRASTNAARVTAFYRSKGHFLQLQMFDDGSHGDGKANDGTYGIFLPKQSPGVAIEYYVSAVTNQKNGGSTLGRSFLPVNAAHHPYLLWVQWLQGNARVMINEFLAKNEKGIVDEANEAEDWIEIRNVTGQLVKLDGMYLTDKVGNPTKWKFPPNQTLQPGGSVIVWADEDGLQGPLHANFKLDASGEAIHIFDTDGTTMVDRVKYGPQVADVSTGRMADGGARWVTFPNPTPAKSNALTGAGSRSYSALDSTLQSIALTLGGQPGPGMTVAFDMSGGQANMPNILFLSDKWDMLELPISSANLLLNLIFYHFASGNFDAAGGWSRNVKLPNIPSLVGASFFFQGWTVKNQVLAGSSGLEIRM